MPTSRLPPPLVASGISVPRQQSRRGGHHDGFALSPIRAGDVHDDRWNEFEMLEEIEVRERLAARVWSEDIEMLARQWLEFRESSKASESRREAVALAQEANDLAKKANDLAMYNNIIATIALITAGIAIAVSILGVFLKG